MQQHRVCAALLAALAACGDSGAIMTEGTGSDPTGDPTGGDPTGSPTSAPTGSDSTTTDPSDTGGDPTGPTGTSEPTTGDPTDTGDPPPPPPAGTCEVPVELVDTANSTAVVGDGTPGSCNESALAAALAGGGVVTFACGGPVTITLGQAIAITSDLVIDGNHEVTLSGGGVTRILDMDTGNFESQGPHLTVQRLRFIDGKASGTEGPLGTDVDGGGGAIFHLGGSVTAIDSVFENNEAATWGPDVAGGAIYGIGVGATTVVGCTFHNNRAANGGAIGALHTALTIVNSTFTDNEATGRDANYIDMMGEQAGHGGNGGAIVMDGSGRELTICGSTVQGNRGGAFGAALFRTGYEGEPTVIDRSTFADNEIPDHDDDDSPSSGALYIQGTAVTLTNSTISGNKARSSAGVWILGHGAQPAVADLTNVTITGNSTWPQDDFTMRGIGAGITIGDDTTGTILNCTIAGNDAQFGAGILRVTPLVVRNTIISNNAENQYTPLNCTGAMFASPPGSGDHNIQWPNGVQDDMDCTPGISRADPLLGALADNGGPTRTIMPLAGSPALAAGSDCPPTDQRGEPRGDPCTLGALESP
ncbi:right-handed parallel beta-helix repeat-containing protein [Nannocystis pusilla]|uniref:Right-handed parallel beta-helix repeat-containing protein n=1 Tax=Nannocystis pusilla TaxID=889268 RepID=A0ABS7TN96_9BACT|nr:right-handed parallel beta-helix repeat-containing protein [Nannocystis pusilla]MBZ5709695.1 right-handed parallel beta-helix repeat-containing protein [Nannocystis pusilla]